MAHGSKDARRAARFARLADKQAGLEFHGTATPSKVELSPLAWTHVDVGAFPTDAARKAHTRTQRTRTFLRLAFGALAVCAAMLGGPDSAHAAGKAPELTATELALVAILEPESAFPVEIVLRTSIPTKACLKAMKALWSAGVEAACIDHSRLAGLR